MSLVFNFMDELLYLFGSDLIIVKDIKVVHFDLAALTIAAWWYGMSCTPCPPLQLPAMLWLL
jgi:hypothetical protein